MADYIRSNVSTISGVNAELLKVQGAIASKVDEYGGGLTGDLNANGQRILNLPAPSSAGEPIRKAEGDALLATALDAAERAEDAADRAEVIGGKAATISVPSVKSLSSQEGAPNLSVYVLSFYGGWAAEATAPVGGGVYNWDGSRSKSAHNGGTVLAPEALVAWNGSQTDLATLFTWTGSGTGCWVKTQEDAIYPESFGLFGGGVADDTLALGAAFKALQVSSVSTLKFQGKKDVLLTNKAILRAPDKTVDGTGIRIMLGSSQAGMQFAGDRIKILGFRGEQTSQTYTPTLIYIFNDATTKRSSFCKVIGVTGYSLYRGVHMYMGDNSSGAACYRHSLYDCEFINQYQQKTWTGSFGISFDGPFDGDAAGNDSKCVNCLTSGYESNFVINNSIATQFVTCSGDGALYCFYYSGLASGLRIVGGYYEYNTHLIGVNGVKYDAYLVYPSVANTISTQITGDEISFISGGWATGTPSATAVSNGAYTTNSNGTSEVYSVNGHTVYSGVSKSARSTLTSAGDWVFNPTTSFSVSGLMNVDTIRGYTGGAVPLRIVNTSTASESKIVFGTNSVDRVEVSFAGDFRASVDAAVSLGDPSHRFSTVYAQTGTINTSDERTKTPILPLSELERKAALEIKGCIGKFKLLDAVEVKGDNARIHFGVGAQTVKQILESHGLDPFNYAFLCFDSWAEGERYGVRYDELAMFILAAT